MDTYREVTQQHYLDCSCFDNRDIALHNTLGNKTYIVFTVDLESNNNCHIVVRSYTGDLLSIKYFTNLPEILQDNYTESIDR